MPVVDWALGAARNEVKGDYSGPDVPYLVCEHFTNFLVEELVSFMDEKYAESYKRETL